jgi:predicted DNA-binding transcriptional regulator YafY
VLETCVRMKFLISSLSYFGRWLLMHTDSVQVESPASLKDIMKELSEKLSAHYISC